MFSRIQFLFGLFAGLISGLLTVALFFANRSSVEDQRMAISLAFTCGFLMGNGVVYFLARLMRLADQAATRRSKAKQEAKLAAVRPVDGASPFAMPVKSRVATGRVCVVCQERILALIDGANCPQCDAAYHQACSGSGGCPSCSGPPPLPQQGGAAPLH